MCPGFVADEGMYADMVTQTGVKASRLLGESKSGEGRQGGDQGDQARLVRAAREPGPHASGAVLGQAFPDVVPRVLKVFGVTALARRVASVQKGAAHPGETEPR